MFKQLSDFTRSAARRISGAAADTSWRAIFLKQPDLRHAFSPGNEQLLSTLRQQHPKLEQAINRLGMPSESALRPPSSTSFSAMLGGETVLHGNESLRANEARNISQAMCDSQVKDRLEADGFIHFEAVVPAQLCDAAKGAVNRHIGQVYGGKAGNRAVGPSALEKSPEVCDVFNKSLIPWLLEHLLGSKPPRVGAGQIALRFPGDF